MQTTTRGIIWRRVILALPYTLLDNNSISGLKYRLGIMNLRTLEVMILIFLRCLRRAWLSYGKVLRKCCTVHSSALPLKMVFKGSVTFMSHCKLSTLPNFLIQSLQASVCYPVCDPWTQITGCNYSLTFTDWLLRSWICHVRFTSLWISPLTVVNII